MADRLDYMEPRMMPTLSYNGTNIDEKSFFAVPLEHPDGIGKLCEDLGISTSSFYKTAWSLVLRTYLGVDDVCFAVSERNPVEILSYDSHQAPMAISYLRLEDQTTIREALLEMKRKDSEPAYRSVSESWCAQIRGVSNTIVLFDESLPEESKASRMCIDWSIAVFVAPNAKQPSIAVQFASALIPNEQAERIVETTRVIISRLLSSLSLPILSICEPTAKDMKVIAERNSKAPESSLFLIHELIKQRTDANPTAEAVYAWDGSLSYSELDELSSSLSVTLQTLGVGAESPVLLCIDKSRWAVVAVLAILKAGGACVPVSPTFSPKRIAEITRLTNSTITVAGTDHLSIFKHDSAHVVSVPPLSIVANSKPFHSVSTQPVGIENTAFIVFTSGSTGEPKGVIKDHASISTSAIAHGKAFSIDAKSRVLQFAAQIWSISIYDFISTLVHGGCICVPSESDRINNLGAAMRDLKVTHATLPPSVITSVIKPNQVPLLQTLILGGEEVLKINIEEWCEKVNLFNNYGTSETLCAAAGRLTKGHRGSTVGYNTSANRCWIVDPDNHNRLMPIGGVGEVVVEGRTVASGYLNDAERTKAVFIQAPTWLETYFPQCLLKSMRFYKTGDLARYGATGEIETMGRKDAQIKIRGQRVELGEIEYYLRRCIPLAVDAVAGLTSVHHIKKVALTAFVCVRKPDGANGDSNRQILAHILKGLDTSLSLSLPASLIPSIFYAVDELPRTPSGKLDRRRLRIWAEEGVFGKSLTLTDCSPAKVNRSLSDSEKSLLLFWNRILTLDTELITPYDNFFHCGGDSVDAIRLIDILRSEGLKLTVQDIFQHAQLGDMATIVQDQVAGDEDEAYCAFALLPSDGIEKIIAEATDQCNIVADAIEDIFPCTPLQEGLMALSQLQQGAYVAQHEFRLARHCTVEDFERAWKALVSETPILRTRIIRSEARGCVQVVLRCGTHYTTEECVKKKTRTVNDTTLPVSMGLGDSLVRSELVEPDTLGQACWLWTMHHAVYDGWSVDLILRRFQQLIYDSQVSEKPEKMYSFRSYIAHLQQVDDSSSKKYWDSELCDYGGPIFPPGIPSSYRPRPNQVEQRQVSVLTRNMNFTMSTLIRAAWSLIVARYCGSPDVVYGAIVTGRTVQLAGVKDIIGPTIAAVPVRMLVKEDQSIDEYLAAVQKQSVDMCSHEHYGLQNIRRLNKGAEHACHFQSLLIIQPNPTVEVQDLVQTGFYSNDYLTYALTIECSLDREMISVEATFDKEILKPKQVNTMLSQFAHVLAQLQHIAASNSELKLRDVQIISPEDETEIYRWNANPPKTTYSCLTPLIEQKVAEYPTAPAVCAWDGDLSYKDLCELSTQLAHELVQHGIGPEEFVPLCFHKSKWLAIAMLAVMKAGGAFILLDLSHPFDRLKYIVQSVNAKVVVCSPEQMKLGLDFGVRAINCQDKHIKSWPLDPSTIISCVAPHNALYSTFTSGSTGKPKGIVIEHWQCASGFQAQVEAGLFTSESRMLQFASAGFDSSIEQILATLLAGGCVCIPREDERLQNLAKIIRELRVNIADLTPSVAKLLMPEDVPDLKVLRLSGESVGSMLPQRWSGNVRLENSYGPSECSVTSLTNCNVVAGSDGCNIGRAIGCRTWIVELDNPNKLAPLGTVGELVIHGPIVGRGYLSPEDMSASGFLEDASWLKKDHTGGATDVNNGRHDSRLYRTGDLVRYESDGSIYFVGRNDSQVKLRGQRIELVEIERQIISHDEVLEAIVTKPSKGLYEGRLIAMVQLHKLSHSYKLGESAVEIVGDENLDLVDSIFDNLREFLAHHLPSYMIPTEWVAVWRFPLSVSGKTDRKALEGWLSDTSDRDKEAVRAMSSILSTSSPLSPQETTALKLSSMVANLCARGDLQSEMAVNGFDMSLQAAGLDSILVITLLKMLNREFHVELSLESLHGGVSIRQLATAIDNRKKGKTETPRAAANFVDEVNHLWLTHHLDCIETQASSPCPSGLKSIFLTGATGYLGTQILKMALGSMPAVKVVVLIRGADVEHGLRRLIKSAELGQWWSNAFLPRIEVWLGNLEKFHLDLTTIQWQRLTGSSPSGDNIDAIIHNGAVVNWYGDYGSLKYANTISTAYLIQALKSSSSLQKLVYVSGGPQWDPNGAEIDNDDTFNTRLSTSNGYGQSKLIAERLIEKTMSARTSIIKPGFVVGTLAEGIANVDDFVWRIVAGSTAIGGYNNDEGEKWIFLEGADVFSSIVLDCLEGTSKPRSMKLLDGLTVRDFWRAVAEGLGQELPPMSHSQWFYKLQLSVDAVGSEHPCWPILHMAQQTVVLGAEKPARLANEQLITQRAVLTVKKNIEYLAHIKYLPFIGTHTAVLKYSKEAFGRGENAIREQLCYSPSC